MTIGSLYVGRVMHRRLRPRMHQLDYRIFSLLLDLDEIDQADRALCFFSRNRLNLLSFHDRDHGDGSATPLREWVAGHLREAGILECGKIRLLAMPRVLGFVFNPLSVYFCEDRAGDLAALIYQVHNTFGDRHCYVIPVANAGRTVRQEVAKRFHVSPFLPMDLQYAFRVKPPSDELMVAITARDARGPVLTAVHSARRRSLSDREILRVTTTHPLMTLKVVAGILWEAGKLLGKRIRIYRRPDGTPPAATVKPVQRGCERAKAA